MNTISRAQFLRGNWRGHKPEIRPPWALQEDLFVEACDGCGACVDDCPQHILHLARGLPQVDFLQGECTFCGDCSRHALPLPHLGFRGAVRVCDQCHRKMRARFQAWGVQPPGGVEGWTVELPADAALFAAFEEKADQLLARDSATLEDVVVPEVAAKFVPAERNVPSLGLSDSAWWARIELENAGDAPQERLLVVSRATLLHVEMFAPGAQPMRFGRYFTYRERVIPHHFPVFPVTLPARSKTNIHLRIQSDSEIYFPVEHASKVWAKTRWATKTIANNSIVVVHIKGSYVIRTK